MRPTLLLIIAPLVLLAAPAAAQDATQDSAPCWDRPGNASPTCVLDRGTFAIETSGLDWTRDRAGGARTDTFVIGDTLLRYGIGADTEVRVGVTPYTRSRTHVPGLPAETADGFGDLGLSLRHRFVDGGDGGVSIALLPFMTIPVGDAAVSDGVVTGGLIVPFDIPVSGGWSLNLSPALATAADADGHGIHARYAGTVALGHALTDSVSATAELFAQRDRDPDGRTTQATADLMLAWQPRARWQFDVAAYAGLNRQTPDLQLVGGFAHRF